MNAELVWTERAESDLKTIYEFNCDTIGEAKAWDLVLELERFISETLSQTMDVSMPDFQFFHLSSDYRKILKGRHKVTFVERGGKKIILRIFDSRQHPDKNL